MKTHVFANIWNGKLIPCATLLLPCSTFWSTFAQQLCLTQECFNLTLPFKRSVSILLLSSLPGFYFSLYRFDKIKYFS